MNNKFLFICVNYNSYDALTSYLQSIDLAAGYAKDFFVDVCIADNSVCKENVNLSFPNLHDVQLYTMDKNLGYLGAVKAVLPHMHTNYDYLAVSNVDLQLKSDFFINITKMHVDSSKIGWIAPSILSYHHQMDRNPKILQRPTKRHLQLTELIYCCPLVYYLYENLIFPHKNHIHSDDNINSIYAGHGAFMLFTQPDFIKNIIYHYEGFLFCEEHFFAEELRKADLSVKYEPQLIIYDSDHISTSKMPSDFYCKCNRESIRFITNKYFK